MKEAPTSSSSSSSSSEEEENENTLLSSENENDEDESALLSSEGHLFNAFKKRGFTGCSSVLGISDHFMKSNTKY